MATVNTEYVEPNVGAFVIRGNVIQFYIGFKALKACPISTELFTLTKYLPVEHTKIDELETDTAGYINYQGRHVANRAIPIDGVYRIAGVYVCR